MMWGWVQGCDVAKLQAAEILLKCLALSSHGMVCPLKQNKHMHTSECVCVRARVCVHVRACG